MRSHDPRHRVVSESHFVLTRVRIGTPTVVTGMRTLILVGLHTGIRIQAEALQLRWEGVDLRRGIPTVQAAYAKNGKTRSVPLNSVSYPHVNPRGRLQGNSLSP